MCTYLRHHGLQDAAQFSAANSILKRSFRTTAKDDKYDSSSQLVDAQVWSSSSFSTTVIVCDVRNSNLGVTFPAAPEHHEWSFWVSPSGLKSWTCLGLKPWICLGLESWMCFIAGLLGIWKILVRRSFKTGLPYVVRLWVAVINQYISTPSHNELSLVANVSNSSCCYVQQVERIGFDREFYCLLFFWEHPSCTWKKRENCTQKQSLVGILAIQCVDSNMGLWMHISLLEKLFEIFISKMLSFIQYSSCFKHLL